MRITLFLSELTAEAEKEISLLRRSNFEVGVFLLPVNDKIILSLRDKTDLVYVWQDIGLAENIARNKYILQVPLVYRHFENWEDSTKKNQIVRNLHRDADKIILTRPLLEKEWLDLNLDIYDQKEILEIADPGLGDLFQKMRRPFLKNPGKC